MWVHWHPDNVIMIKDANNLLYVGTVAEVESLIGESLSLPEGINERQYRPGISQADFDGSTKYPLEGSWLQGDKILTHATELIESKLEEN